jgi:hypothetical protein
MRRNAIWLFLVFCLLPMRAVAQLPENYYELEYWSCTPSSCTDSTTVPVANGAYTTTIIGLCYNGIRPSAGGRVARTLSYAEGAPSSGFEGGSWVDFPFRKREIQSYLGYLSAIQRLTPILFFFCGFSLTIDCRCSILFW